MFKPVGDFMIVEVVKKTTLHLPENMAPSQGDVFRVVAMGEGILLDDGKTWQPDIHVDDHVCLIGKILKLPNGLMLAKMTDVVAVDVVEEVPDKI